MLVSIAVNLVIKSLNAKNHNNKEVSVEEIIEIIETEVVIEKNLDQDHIQLLQDLTQVR